MKIIKPGKSKNEIERIIKQVRKFECATCGCIFEADNTEYKHNYDQKEGEEWWTCNCPNCGKQTDKSIPTW